MTTELSKSNIHAVADLKPGYKLGATDVVLLQEMARRLLAAEAQPVQVPEEMTPEMMRAVQLNSELGAYVTANLSGAYGLFSEFWKVACRAAMLSAAPVSQPTAEQHHAAKAALLDLLHSGTASISPEPEND